jgi:hypothetical protein
MCCWSCPSRAKVRKLTTTIDSVGVIGEGSLSGASGGRRLNRGRWVPLLLVPLLLAGIAYAQKPPQPREPGHPPSQGSRGPRPGPQAAAGKPRPPGWFKRLRDLPPEQQKRRMARNPDFRRLPPERRRAIRQRLAHYNVLTPEQKQLFKEREEIFERLPPDKQRIARQLAPAYARLPPARQQAVLGAFRRLRDLPPDQREPFLASPQTQQRFSPQERDLLRGLGRLLPEPGANPPEDPGD